MGLSDIGSAILHVPLEPAFIYFVLEAKEVQIAYEALAAVSFLQVARHKLFEKNRGHGKPNYDA